jgi:transcription factor STE12
VINLTTVAPGIPHIRSHLCPLYDLLITMEHYPYQQSYSSPASPEPYMPPVYPHQPFPHPHKSYSLQVSTTHQSQHDPQEYTARPSNAGPSSLPFAMEPTPTQGHAPISLPSQPAPILDQAMHSSTPDIPSSAPQAAPAGLTQLTRPLNPQEQENLAHLDRLKFFLATAPSLWDASAAAELADTKNDAYSRPPTADGYPRPPTSDGFPRPGSSSDPYPPTSDPHDAFNFTPTNHSSPASSVSADHSSSNDHQSINPSHPHPSLNRFLLPSNEYVSCVLWSGLYHITGTDIVRALVFR